MDFVPQAGIGEGGGPCVYNNPLGSAIRNGVGRKFRSLLVETCSFEKLYTPEMRSRAACRAGWGHHKKSARGNEQLTNIAGLHGVNPARPGLRRKKREDTAPGAHIEHNLPLLILFAFV